MSADTYDPTVVRNAWDAIADDFDRRVTPQTIALGDEVMSRLGATSGMHVIDVGAGSGGLSIPAARAGADVVAFDIAPVMVDHLRTRAQAEGLTNLDARVGDGTDLDVDDDRFDLAVSMNGVSLFPDLDRGMRELVRVTRPGGEVAVVTFGPLAEVEFISFFIGALRAVAPDLLPPPTTPLPPFRLAAPGALQQCLGSAGLADATVEHVTWRVTVGSPDELWGLLVSSNPIPRQLVGRLTDAQARGAREVLDGMLQERAQDQGRAVLESRMLVGRGTV